MTKKKDLQNMPLEELNKNLAELKIELIKANAQVASGTTPKNPGQIKKMKKTIARIITIGNKKRKEVLKKHE